MNKEMPRQPLALNLSREMWEALTLEQQQEQRDRFVVSVAPSYVPAHDLDTPIELAMVPRFDHRRAGA